MNSKESSQHTKNLELGQRFSSFEEFKACLKEYEVRNRQRFTIRASKKIGSPRTVSYPINEELVYYEVHYGCVHRMGFKYTGMGIRKSSTLRGNCPAVIKLRSSNCGSCLIIKQFKDEHKGHDLSQTFVGHLNQKLNKNERLNVQRCADLGANVKQIQNIVFSQGDKTLPIKEVQSIVCNMKESHNNDIWCIIELLEDMYGCSVSVLFSEDGAFKALYFSTKTMRNNMQAWPEFITIESTYKLPDDDCTIFLLLVEDADGLSEIVGVGLTTSIEKDSVTFFLNCFKDENIQACSKIKCFMGDKDSTKQILLKETFPGVSAYICLCKGLKTLRRELNAERLDITKSERNLSLKYIQKLIYSSSDDEYKIILAEFKDFAPRSVVEYFQANESHMNDDWTTHNAKNNFLDNASSRMESVSIKFKQVIGKNSNMTEFIKNLFVFLNLQQFKQDHRTANYTLKRPVSRFQEGSCMYKYEMHLTRYSFEYVLQQLECKQRVSILSNDNGVYLVKTRGANIKVTVGHCECKNFKFMFLPCQHIFAVRSGLNLPLFDESLCDGRWTRSYYLNNHRSSSQVMANTLESVINKMQTISHKRKQMMQVADSLANLGSLSCDGVFEKRLKLLKDIELSWKQGYDVDFQLD